MRLTTIAALTFSTADALRKTEESHVELSPENFAEVVTGLAPFFLNYAPYMLRSKFKDASGNMVQKWGFTRDGNSQWLALRAADANKKDSKLYWLMALNDAAHTVTT